MLTKLLLIAVIAILMVLYHEFNREIEEDKNHWGWYCEEEEA